MSWYATKKASKLPSMDKSKILIFDVETTGRSATLGEIIQIVILDGYGNNLFSSFLKPTRHKKWPKAQKVNGIDYSMVKDAPTFKQVKKEIQEIFNNASLVVGYNVGFDINFVEAAGIVVGGARFDVMTAFASYRAGIEHSKYRNCKLIECAEYFGYFFNPHDASEDAKATLHCFNSLIADERFTTYKRRDREQLQEELPAVKKGTRFTITFKGGKLKSFLIGLILFAVGIIILSLKSKIAPIDLDAIKQFFFYAKDNISDPQIVVCIIAVVVGCLIVFMRIIRMILLFPKWVIVHFQRLFKHF